MKKNLFWLFALVLSVSATFTACEEDLCKDVDCGANGSCFEGSCVCNEGYEGTNCDTEWSAKYVGNWKSDGDKCTDAAGAVTTYDPYFCQIAKTDATTVSMTNFGGFGLAVLLSGAKVERNTAGDATQINLAGVDNGGRKFTGTASIATDGKLTYSYVVEFSDGTKDNCTGTATKQ